MLLRPIVCLLALSLPFSAALALSPELTPGQGAPATEPAVPPLGPTPGAWETPPEGQAPAPAEPPPAEAAPAEPAQPGAATALPGILRSDSDMPAPVADMRRRLMEAAKSGDIELLRALMDAQPEQPAVSFGDPGDAIEYLKALSSDADGREILAILLEVLESGFVHTGAGTDEELYVWPYFAQYPLDSLTPQQLVELFTLLTAADYEDMRSYGSYTFFRVGIAPDGRWLFFLAGD
jgi:hypothetical protein